MADVNRGNRPLSPHLSIYRYQISMVTSIMNRMTGAGMVLAAIMVVWWLLAAASGPEYYAAVNAWMTSWPAMLIWVGSIWAFWFHALAGLRHLIMDFGYGYELPRVNFTSWLIVGLSLVLAVITILVLA